MQGLTTRFFYVLQAVLDVSAIAFLANNHFNSEILVIFRFTIECISQFYKLNIAVFLLITVFNVKTPVILIKWFCIFQNIG